MQLNSEEAVDTSEALKRHDMSFSFDKHFVGFNPEYPTENGKETDAEQTTEKSVNHDFVQYILERDAARDRLKAKELELAKAHGKNYELLTKIEALEEELKQLKSKTVVGQTSATKPKPKGKLPPLKNSNAAEAKKPTPKNTKTPSSQDSPSHRHPKVFGREKLSTDSYAYYNMLAEHFPGLSLSLILDAEKRFTSADTNGDQVIDLSEMDNILTANNMMFTKKQLEEILESIDTDKNGYLDFLEVLTVIERLSSNKRSKLSPHLQTATKSATCSIQ
ncbi:uncharacterized protein LOC106167149 [Lingula anatina]|uniref:Uncharacterized protein LOC106167149 n=2 Tax=Lingula anatina TaxID=7574 RepID=A0A2R2MNI5_LINAN|nr:uncharacterized protein LOC106167149 [Lingula anatina]|eukprot:XP_023931776.1 uncharacterized protein LOC106167149 [Lingula anatina]